MKTKLIFAFLLLPSFFLLPPSAFPQGSLTPPGGPAPTMKTLDQVQPRTPLPGGTATASIVASGSYYLTGNLNISTDVHGISISGSVSNVTIDLNGFTLTGPSAGSSSGIFLSSGVSNVRIANGTIRNFGSHGINGIGNSKVRVENVRAISNLGQGIIVDVNGEVLNCIAESNVSAGIAGTDNCIVKDSQAILTTGSSAPGISVGASCLVTGCVAISNNGTGISVAQGSTVSGCNAFGNGAGIRATSNCLILSNNCESNGAGILTTASSNRIEANNVTSAVFFQTGIQVTGDNSLIIRNSARGNSPNYDIAANNKVGFIVSAPNSGAINGSTGGAGVGSTDPWANFSY